MKKRISALLLVLCLLSALCGCADQTPTNETSANEPPAAVQTDDPADYVDDFYDAVNHDTLAGWEIPADQPSMGWFHVAREESYKKVDAIIQEASSGDNYPTGGDLYNIRALYLTGLERETRNREGYGQQAGAFLEKVEEAATVRELLKACLVFDRDYGFRSFIGFVYLADSKDSSVKVAYLAEPDTGLSREIWFSEDVSNQKRIAEYIKYLIKLHELNGMSRQEAENTVADVTVMMKDLASSTLKAEELYEPEKTYNVYTAKDVTLIYSDVLPVELLKDIYGIEEDETIIVEQQDVCRKAAGYLKEENLPLLKEYVKTCLYSDFSLVSDTASLEARMEYERVAMGVAENKAFDRTVSEAVQSLLEYQCGRVYCERHFDEASKENVTAIIHQVIDEYEQRLSQMEWMTEATRREARKKLAAIVIKVGYPDEWPQEKYDLELKAPEDGGTYVDNYLIIRKAAQDYAYKTKNDPVDRNEWQMSPQTVNAYYNPANNEIVFPAGILQYPFYDAEAAPVSNLGGIGTVIAHEITHAFDIYGSQYDEKGNLRDWWTVEDKQKFEELAQKVADYYSAMEVNGIRVNGDLTLGENIADLGAVSCTTAIAKKEGYDLKELYKAYALIWASKSKDEFISYIMTTDEHAPDVIRINAVLSAIEDFYTAFEVKEGDGMYQKPEDRPKIW